MTIEEDTDAIATVIRALQGGGYSTVEDSERDRLVRVWAYACALSKERIDQSLNESFVQSISETLEEYELSARLPNDTGRSVQERIDRMRALHALSGHFTVERLGRALELIGIGQTAEYITGEGGDEDRGAERAGALQTTLRLSEADFGNPPVRKGIEEIVTRSAPVRAIGQLGDFTRGFAANICTATGATYANATATDGRTQTIGRVVIRSTENALDTDKTNWLAQVEPFGPLSILRGSRLNRMQRSLFCNFGYNGSPWSFGIQDGAANSFGAYVADLATQNATTTLDTNFDWRDRFVVWSGFCATTDCRPGGAAEGNSHTRLTLLWYTGSGSYTSVELASGSLIRFDVNAGNGNLEIDNGNVSTDYYVCGMFHASGQMTRRSNPASADRFVTLGNDESEWITFKDGDAGTKFPTNFCERLYEAGGFTHCDQGDIGNAVVGGIRRVCVFNGAAEPPTNGNKATFLLDSSDDWRDRFLDWTLVAWNASTGIRPGFPGDDAHTTVGRRNFGYTGPGRASDGDKWEAESAASLTNVEGVFLYADETDGYLYGKVDAGFNYAPGSIAFLISATEQLGEQVGVTQNIPIVPQASPSAGTEIRPRDLNRPQDVGLFQQGGQGILLSAVHAPPPVDSAPLGPIKKARVPLEILIRKDRQWRLSGVNNSPEDFYVRQNIAGRIALAGEAIISSTGTPAIIPLARAASLDRGIDRDLFDWRDRVVTIHAAFSDSDIRPGQANDFLVNTTATQEQATFYTGPGDGESAAPVDYIASLDGGKLRLFAQRLDVIESDFLGDGLKSDLLLHNEGPYSVNRYMVFFVEASPQLGLWR